MQKVKRTLKRPYLIVAVLLLLLTVAFLRAPLIKSVQANTCILRTYKWSTIGVVDNYRGGLSYLQDEIMKKVEGDLENQLDEQGNHVKIAWATVSLLSWQEVSTGVYDITYNATVKFYGMFSSGSISSFCIAFIKPMVLTLVKWIALMFIVWVAYLITTVILEPAYETRHVIEYDKEGNIIKEYDETIPVPKTFPTITWTQADPLTILLMGIGIISVSTVVVVYLLGRKKE